MNDDERIMRRMRNGARSKGKTVPTLEQLRAIWTNMCQICATPMLFSNTRDNLQAKASLQHWPEDDQRENDIGPYGLVHHPCNARHNNLRAYRQLKGQPHTYNIARERPQALREKPLGNTAEWHQELISMRCYAKGNHIAPSYKDDGSQALTRWERRLLRQRKK